MGANDWIRDHITIGRDHFTIVRYRRPDIVRQAVAKAVWRALMHCEERSLEGGEP